MIDLSTKLKRLTETCKGGFLIEVNPHLANYETIEEYLDDEIKNNDIDPENLKRLVDSNTLIYVRAYPNTPIGFYQIFENDIDKAIDCIIECIKN